MKDGIHPNYREVVFLDTSCDFGFVTRSTVATNETIKWKDGKEYPVYKIEISAESPSVLHGQAEDRGHRRPRGQVQEALRPQGHGEGGRVIAPPAAPKRQPPGCLFCLRRAHESRMTDEPP